MVVLVGTWYGLRGITPGSLEQPRAHLQARFQEPSEHYRYQYAHQAELLLRDYLGADGPDRDSATILLIAALNFQRKTESAATLLPGVETTKVSAADLMLAAQSLAETQQLASAEQLVTAALAKGGPQADALRLAIKLRLALGKDEAVVRACHELAKIAPNDPHPWVMLAALYEQRGYYELLIAVYERIAKLSPRQAKMAQYGLIEVLMEAGDIRRARRELDLLKADAAQILDAAPLLEAKLLHMEGDLEKSLAIVEKFRQKQPQDAKALQLQGRILLAQSKTEGAVEVLQALVAIQPESSAAHYLLGQAYGLLQQPELAQQHSKRHRELLESDVNEFLAESGLESPDEASTETKRREAMDGGQD